MRSTILTLLIVSCIYTVATFPVEEIKSVSDFDEIITKADANTNIFVFFADEEPDSKRMQTFWEKQQDTFDELQRNEKIAKTRVYYVNVKKLIELQRRYDVDRRGDTIYFQNGDKKGRSPWISEEKMKRWVKIMLEPEEVEIEITFKDFEEKRKENSILICLSKERIAKQATMIMQLRGVESYAMNEEEEKYLKEKYQTNIGEGKNLMFYWERERGKYHYEDFGEVEKLQEMYTRVEKWVSAAKLRGIKSIDESNAENFQKFSEIYKYIAVVPYPEEKKEEYLSIIFEVEENEENAEFGFLHVEVKKSIVPFPMTVEVTREQTPKRDMRTMWDTKKEFTRENFAEWIMKIRTQTIEPFTSVEFDVPEVLEVIPPIKVINFEGLVELQNNDKEYSIVYAHSYEQNSIRVYDLLKKVAPRLTHQVYLYNIMKNTYVGPPTPVIIIMKGKNEVKIPARGFTDAKTLHEQIIAKIRKLAHHDEL